MYTKHSYFFCRRLCLISLSCGNIFIVVGCWPSKRALVLVHEYEDYCDCIAVAVFRWMIVPLLLQQVEEMAKLC